MSQPQSVASRTCPYSRHAEPIHFLQSAKSITVEWESWSFMKHFYCSLLIYHNYSKNVIDIDIERFLYLHRVVRKKIKIIYSKISTYKKVFISTVFTHLMIYLKKIARSVMLYLLENKKKKEFRSLYRFKLTTGIF